MARPDRTGLTNPSPAALHTVVLKLILASQSPRRRELIRLLGCPYQVATADVDETRVQHADPAVQAAQTARLKALTLNRQFDDSGSREPKVIVAADTIVALDERALGKPADEAEAQSMLRDLRGRTHEVHTGLALLDLTEGREVCDWHCAVVTMRDYSDQEIEAYIATGDPMDKAGAYAIQHPWFRPVSRLKGCFTGVMGLSVCHLLQALNALGLETAADMKALVAAHQGFACSLYDELDRSG